MGICQSNTQINRQRNRISGMMGNQRFSAPVNDLGSTYNTGLDSTFNTTSRNDLFSYNDFLYKKPSPLHKYKGIYYKNEEQISLMTAELLDLGENSMCTNQIKASKIRNEPNSVFTEEDETENEQASNYIEIIHDGRMDVNMVKKSPDQTTFDNYKEYCEKNESQNNKNMINMYNTKVNMNPKNNIITNNN